MSSVAEGNVGAAFAIAFGAGLSTTIGAAMPFFRQVKASDKRILAGALALSGGVMIFVSFAEILQVKAVESFQESRAEVLECGDDADCFDGTYGYALASAYATFFAGVALTKMLDVLVHRMTGETDDEALDEIFNNAEAVEKGVELKTGVSVVAETGDAGAAAELSVEDSLESGDHTDDAADADESPRAYDDDADDDSGSSEMRVTKGEHGPMEVESDSAESLAKARHNRALQKMSMMAGLALAIHNFPEGLATFAATLADPSVGASLGVAIAIHNIPEGVVVAMPVYYATGSKWKGFFWATMSGVAEPVGALLGYAVLVNAFDVIAYGILFSLVGGMMVYIVIGELLPTALKYDPRGELVVPLFFIGAFVMALSLVAFQV